VGFSTVIKCKESIKLIKCEKSVMFYYPRKKYNMFISNSIDEQNWKLENELDEVTIKYIFHYYLLF